MEEKGSSRRRRPPSLAGALILITIGALVLLANLGMLHVNFLELWRLWPLLLILFGLDILFARRSVLGRLVVFVVSVGLLGGAIWLLVASPGPLRSPTSAAVEQISQPLGSIEQANLTLNFAAGKLDVAELTDSSSLIEGTLNLATDTKPEFTVNQGDGRATMTLGYREGQTLTAFTGGDDWQVRLSPKVGLTLNVEVGAGDARLDLTGLDIRGLQVSGGASQTTVVFPATGDFPAQVSGGVGGLTLEIPAAMAARLQIDRGLSGLNLPSRFTRVGQYYETSDWATSQNRVDVDLSMGVGLLTIREP